VSETTIGISLCWNADSRRSSYGSWRSWHFKFSRRNYWEFMPSVL